MITNVGKNIIAKYLLGQAPSYASYIAVGCGAKPLEPYVDGDLPDYSNKTDLDFEMFRVPISARGIVNDDGVSKIVLTAEIPTEERYEITEVGIFSAASNPVAGSFDSRNIFSFTDTDNWLYQPFNSPAIDIPVRYEPLNGDEENNNINETAPVFETNADNRVFTDEYRLERNERCRFLNNIVAIVGNNSTLTRDELGIVRVTPGSKYIRLNETTVDLSKNSPLDELKFAFSVVNKVANSNTVPDNVKILLEFSYIGTNSLVEYARFEVDIDDESYLAGTADDTFDFSENRYVVATKSLKDLRKTDNFDWREVNIVKIYSCVTEAGSPSNLFYVCLDGLRLENVTSTNSLYGLTGYSVIKNVGSRPIIKSANTTNYIEFRFALDVG
jgi:hypothetical protein